MINFSIVGSGNMARFLAKKLNAAGHQLQGIYARDKDQALAFSKEFDCQIYSQFSEIPDAENHCCFIAISDTAIPEIAAQLSFQSTTTVHCAGASSINILEKSAKQFGVFWVIYSITHHTESIFEGIPIAIEGNDATTQNKLLQLAQSISSKAFVSNEKQRLQLHLAAVFANNFSNHMMAVAEDICAAEKLSFDYLKPIILQSFRRLQNESPKAVQTGPARRSDQITMQKHLALLEHHEGWKALYQSVSDSITKMYEPIEG